MEEARQRTLVQTAEELESLLAVLQATPVFALDTESNSFHVYFERVCLLQVSTAVADFIIDPFAVDVRPLGVLLADPAVEKVMHAADYDVRCLKREWGFALAGLFDTMLAAKLLRLPQLGLAALIEERFGVRLAKANQRSDWGRRPLSQQQVEYAFTDTRYLLELRDGLKAQLEHGGLLAAARTAFARQEACVPRPKRFDPKGFRALRGLGALDPAQRAVAEALWLLREEWARAADRPPFKVFGEDTLMDLARLRPTRLDQLRGVRGLGESAARQYGAGILEAVGAAGDGSRPA